MGDTLQRGLPLALVGGLVGAALNLVFAVPLYPGVDLVFGAIPALMVALVAGARAGALAMAVAALPTVGLWGHWVAWGALALEGAVVGWLGRRVHPSVIVAAYWLVVGLPIYALAHRLYTPNFSEMISTIAMKTPMQEVFASLVALTLLFLGGIRGALERYWPRSRLPVVSLRAFQLTFLSLLLVGVAGATLLIQGRNLYADQRELTMHYNQGAAETLSDELTILLEGYGNTMITLGVIWDRLTLTERASAVQRVLASNRYHGLLWLDAGMRLRRGWLRGEDGQPVLLPALDLSTFGPKASTLATGEVAVEWVHLEVEGARPLLVVITPMVGPEGGYIAGLVTREMLQQRLFATFPVEDLHLTLLDERGEPILRAGPPPPVGSPPLGFPGVPADSRAVVAATSVPGTDWSVRVATPARALRAAANDAMWEVVPALLVLLLVLGTLGSLLMMVLGREMRALEQATRVLGQGHGELPASRSFLKEVRDLNETYREVHRELSATLEELRRRDAEMKLAMSQQAATVEELQALDRNRTEVINAISHDIKIPLTAVQGYAELLDDELAGPLNPAQRGYVEGILDNGGRTIRLLEDLLDLARLEVGRFKVEALPVDVAEAVERTRRNLQPLIDRQGLRATVEVAPELAPVMADPARLEQVLNNLISNAIKFTPKGGALRFRAGPAADGRSAIVQVIDTGEGIAPEHMPHLFERFNRFSRSKAPGTGLGLAISKKLVEAMGGQIGALSQPGRGSTFWFTLPWAEVEAPALAPPRPSR